MSVRSRKMLLAGVAALLGMSLTGTGCQPLGLRDPQSGPPPAAVLSPTPVNGFTAPAGAAPVATIQRPIVRRPLFGGAPAETTVISDALPAGGGGTALQPVPSGTAASTWTTVRRVSAEGPAVTMEKPLALAAVPGAGAPDPSALPAPMPAATEEPPKAAQVLPAPKLVAAPPPVEKTQLPAPRVVKRDSYPDLPPVGIHHPIEAPREFGKRALSTYIIEPPDVLMIEGTADLLDPDKKVAVAGPALVRPDGTVGLGTYGNVFVAGMTLEQAKEQIARLIQTRQPKEDLDTIKQKLKVDVAAFNSKFYYVIADGAGYGEQVIRVPITGNETVLDAISQIQGLPAVASKKRIWLARATPDGHGPNVLPIDWKGIAMRGSAATNYQVFPGDRIYIHSDKLLTTASIIGKVLAPVERILGVTLLGSSVVNSIKNGGNSGGNSGNNVGNR